MPICNLKPEKFKEASLIFLKTEDPGSSSDDLYSFYGFVL
jgi:hypothetical protein